MNASDIMKSAAVLLLDEDHVRWPLDELAGWIDEGVNNIVLVKPSSSSVTVTLSLAEGTKQKLPDDQGIVMLLDITRNVGGEGLSAGRIIKPTSRNQLDAADPYWHNPARWPFRSEVRQFVFDEVTPREYYVFPGNDGTGSVEAAVSKLPTSVVSQVQEGADLSLIETWDVPVGLADEYRAPVLDYVLFRCFDKEDPAAAPGQAVTHYQAFATALGIQSQVETANTPNRKK